MSDKNQQSGPLRARYLGIVSIQPLSGCMSASRISMLCHQLPANKVLVRPEPKIFKTSLEEDLKRHTYSIAAPCDLKVLDVIYNNTGAQPTHEILTDSLDATVKREHVILYEDINTKEIGSITVPRATHFTYHQVADIKIGDYLNKGTVIADSVGAIGDEYEFTTTVNVAFTTDRSTAEDAVSVNEDILPKFEYQVIHNFTIDVFENQTLLNMFGDENRVQVLPKVGDIIDTKEGIIAVKRTFTKDNIFALGHPKAMREIDYTNGDQVYQTSVDGVSEVIGIRVLRHKNKSINSANLYESDLNDLAGSTSGFNSAIVDSYIRARNAQRRSGLPGKATNEFNSSLMRGLVQYGNDRLGIKSPKLTRKKAEVPPYTIEVYVRQHRTATNGAKITDMFASKGIISKIKPASQMPRDSYGRVVDVMKSADSIGSRNIPGEPHEHYLGNASDLIQRDLLHRLGIWSKDAQLKQTRKPSARKIKKELKRICNMDGGKERIVDCVREIADFYNVINCGKYPDHVSQHIDAYTTGHTTIEVLREFLEEALIHRVFIYLTVDMVSDIGIANIITAVRNSRFAPIIGPVTWENEKGETRTTHDAIMIAPMAVMTLEQDGRSASSSYSAQLQSMRMVSSPASGDKQVSPMPRTNVRMVAMDNTVVLSAVIGAEGVAEMLDLCNNPDARRERVKSIMSAQNPIGVESHVDRNKVPYNAVALNQLNHTLACFGTELVYIDERHPTNEKG